MAEIPKCPKCGAPAGGTLETIHGCTAFLTFDDAGNGIYVGSTDVNWNGQKTDLGPNGRPILVCGDRACDGEWEAPEGFVIA